MIPSKQVLLHWKSHLKPTLGLNLLNLTFLSCRQFSKKFVNPPVVEIRFQLSLFNCKEVSKLRLIGNIPLQTYSVDAQTPDSSSTATAIFSGVKTDINTLGFDNSVVNGSVASEETAHKVDSVMAWAQEAGKDTGNSRIFLL